MKEAEALKAAGAGFQSYDTHNLYLESNNKEEDGKKETGEDGDADMEES